MPEIGLIQGRFLPLADALVPLEDRGYQFGDGVYEVIRTYQGVPFQLEAHLERLQTSAQAIQLALPYQDAEWKRMIIEGIRLAEYPECKIYIQVTRGVAPRDHAFPQNVGPSAVMTIREMLPVPLPVSTRGVNVLVIEDIRWGRCDIKCLNLLPNVLARQQARSLQAFEAVFVRDDQVTEGAISNVFMVNAGVVVTCPVGPQLLAGVTRQLVLELAKQEGISIEERVISLTEFKEAAEIFLTGTTIEILPVVKVNGAPLNSGLPGPITSTLINRFQSLVGGNRLH